MTLLQKLISLPYLMQSLKPVQDGALSVPRRMIRRKRNPYGAMLTLLMIPFSSPSMMLRPLETIGELHLEQARKTRRRARRMQRRSSPWTRSLS